MRITASRMTGAASVLGIVLGASIAVDRSNRTRRETEFPADSDKQCLQAAIDRANATYLTALRLGDARSFAELFTEDAMQMPATGSIVRGRAGVADAMTSTFERVRFVGGSLRTIEAWPAGSTAYEVGTYNFSVCNRFESGRRGRRGASIQTVSGRYLVVWRRTHGEWKIAMDFGQPTEPRIA